MPESGVLGRVAAIQRGSSLIALRTPRAFVSDGLAPADTRPDFYLRLALVALASIAALLILTLFGPRRFVSRGDGGCAARRRRSARAARRPGGWWSRCGGYTGFRQALQTRGDVLLASRAA